MKLYLAGPMRGIKDFNFPAFHAAAAKLRSEGNEVFSPAERDIAKYGDVFYSETGDEKNIPAHVNFSLREALGADLSYICAEAEGIALLPNWDRSKGACAEAAAGIALNLEIIKLDENYDIVGAQRGG